VVLAVAGLDPSGGAGLLADTRVIAACGAWPAGVATALTEQDSRTVARVHAVDAELVARQIERVVADMDVAVVKIGMLANGAVARAVARALAGVPAPIVLDPVLRATAGAPLVDDAESLWPLVERAAVVTPNLIEARELGGVDALLARGARAVLVKGGHGEGDPEDVLYEASGVTRWRAPRVSGGDVHGTGCTLAAALAAALAQGAPLADACERARAFVHERLATARPLGEGSRFLW
jgi:hydroxymethylpyrimidine/phosphomethylpyrimidine kinase